VDEFTEIRGDVIRNVDWILDLGPEWGSKGGRVVFAGTPMDLLNAPDSLTSRYLEPGLARLDMRNRV